MGHTTKKSCRDFIATTVTSGLILDRAKSSGVFTHDAENCHHLILATLPEAGDKLEIHASIDGTTFFHVASETAAADKAATGFHVSYDTGVMAGVSGCAPKYVRLFVDNGGSGATTISKLQVRTYGSVVLPPVQPSA